MVRLNKKKAEIAKDSPQFIQKIKVISLLRDFQIEEELFLLKKLEVLK